MPVLGKHTAGCWSVDEEGEAPGNDHIQPVGLPVLRSLKVIHAPSQRRESDAEKEVTGGTPIVTA